jgi:mannosyltransferase
VPNPSNHLLLRRFLPSIATQAARITAPGYWNVEQLLFLGIILLGLILRLAKITHEFDPDEVFTAKIAGRSFLRMIESTLADRPHPPLYNILLWAWKGIMGPTEVATRLFSIGTFVGFMVLTRMFLRKFCSNAQTLLALFLFATSPFFVFMDNRCAAMHCLRCSLAANLVALSNVCNRKDAKSHLLWLLSCALLVHTQYLSVIFIALESAVVILSGRIPRLVFLLYTLAGLATIAPWALAAFWDAMTHDGDPIPHIAWIRRPTFDDVQWFYAGLLHHGRNSVPWFYEFIADYLRAAHKYIATLTFAVAAALFSIRQATAKKISIEATTLLAFAFIAPLIFYFISVFGPKSIFLPRQLVGTAIGCIVLLGAVVTESRALAARFYMAVLILYGLTAGFNVLTTDIRQNYKNMATYIVEQFDDWTLVTQDDWNHLLPMTFYADKPVYILKSFNSRDGEFLYLCESGHCEEVYTGELRSRAEFLKAVTWGKDPNACTINLFKVRQTPETDRR